MDGRGELGNRPAGCRLDDASHAACSPTPSTVAARSTAGAQGRHQDGVRYASPTHVPTAATSSAPCHWSDTGGREIRRTRGSTPSAVPRSGRPQVTQQPVRGGAAQVTRDWPRAVQSRRRLRRTRNTAPAGARPSDASHVALRLTRGRSRRARLPARESAARVTRVMPRAVPCREQPRRAQHSARAGAAVVTRATPRAVLRRGWPRRARHPARGWATRVSRAVARRSIWETAAARLTPGRGGAARVMRDAPHDESRPIGESHVACCPTPRTAGARSAPGSLGRRPDYVSAVPRDGRQRRHRHPVRGGASMVTRDTSRSSDGATRSLRNRLGAVWMRTAHRNTPGTAVARSASVVRYPT